MAGAARVVSVDTSERALALARRHWEENGLPPELGEFVREDAQAYLRRREELFDLLVLDPPALVQHRIDLPRGSRAYRELNRAAFERCAPGAFVLTFTCSPHVKPDLFRKLVATAAADAGKDVQVLAALGPGIDHPSHLGHPEGDYLHGLLLRIRGSTSKSHIGAGHPCAGGIAHAGESG
ncbi:MAG: hypothetical protein KatS3mg076_2681 [Candidatus Binatia bacterium]|nr:MAG: hypothetical protein KatS3mg076_2681 [Candidatus Binatia bacterium]